MERVYANILVAILVTLTAGFAAESSERSVAIITGEVRNPTAREITFKYDTPEALGKQAEQRVLLDSRNRFTLQIPVVRGTLVRGSYKSRSVPWKWVRQAASYVFRPSPLVLFVEPGDSLHISIHPRLSLHVLPVQRPQRGQQPLYCRMVSRIPGFPEENQGLPGNGGG